MEQLPVRLGRFERHVLRDVVFRSVDMDGRLAEVGFFLVFSVCLVLRIRTVDGAWTRSFWEKFSNNLQLTSVS